MTALAEEHHDGGELGLVPLVSCRDVGFSYAGASVFTGVDLAIMPGEMVALRGESGSGKSTLLHVLAGLMRPTVGEVWLSGERYDGWSDRRRAALRLRSFGVVFQGSDLIPELSVGENVELPLRLLGASKREARERARQQLGGLGVGELYDRQLGRVSGGQAQRVAIARALVHRPALLLADEPTGALDEQNATASVQAMVSMVREQGAAGLVVTHDARVAAMCDRNVAISAGRLVGAGETAGEA